MPIGTRCAGWAEFGLARGTVGGPTFGAPRPDSLPTWLNTALTGFRVEIALETPLLPPLPSGLLTLHPAYDQARYLPRTCILPGPCSCLQPKSSDHRRGELSAPANTAAGAQSWLKRGRMKFFQAINIWKCKSR